MPEETPSNKQDYNSPETAVSIEQPAHSVESETSDYSVEYV